MKKRAGKKAQFYIIAAIAIILVVTGLIAANYFSPEKKFSVVYDLADILKIESGHVVDYGIYNFKNENMEQREQEIKTLMNQWALKVNVYSRGYLSEDNIIFFVYGDEKKVSILWFGDQESDIYADFGDLSLQLEVIEEVVSETEYERSIDGELPFIVKIQENENEEIKYEFDLKQGQNFYFIIKTKKASVQK